MAYHSLQNKAPSPEYDKGYVDTFGAKDDPWCPGCGLRRAWCECDHDFTEGRRAFVDGLNSLPKVKPCGDVCPGCGEPWDKCSLFLGPFPGKDKPCR